MTNYRKTPPESKWTTTFTTQLGTGLQESVLSFPPNAIILCALMMAKPVTLYAV